MKWQLRRGIKDGGDLGYYFLVILSFIVCLPLFCVSITSVYQTFYFDTYNSTIIYSSVDRFFAVLSIVFFGGEMLFTLSMGNWMFERFRLSSEGIHLKSFTNKRIVKWSSIEKAAIYKVYFGRNNDGPFYIMAFLDWKKRPKRLDHDLCYFKRKYVVMIRATEENVKEFESYWGKPLEMGKQKGHQYGW